MRLFFAVEIGEEASGEAWAAASELADCDVDGAVRWVPRENYHATLRFLGATAAEQIPRLLSEVSRESASQAAFRATLGALLLLPSSRRPRVIALEIESEGYLEALADCVERGVCRAGVAPSDRPFRPHLTLGRTRRGRAYRGAAALPLVSPARASFRVDAALLVESELSRQGARYRALERIPLGASAHPH